MYICIYVYMPPHAGQCRRPQDSATTRLLTFWVRNSLALSGRFFEMCTHLSKTPFSRKCSFLRTQNVRSLVVALSCGRGHGCVWGVERFAREALTDRNHACRLPDAGGSVGHANPCPAQPRLGPGCLYQRLPRSLYSVVCLSCCSVLVDLRLKLALLLEILPAKA